MDVRQQILNTPVLQPRGEGRNSPIAAVILTNADVDHAGGLRRLRERQPFSIWGTRGNLETLGANRMFDVVARDLVPHRAAQGRDERAAEILPILKQLPGSAQYGPNSELQFA